MDSSKPITAAFNKQNKMRIENTRLNFCLPNYIVNKNANAKYTLKLSKKQYNSQRLVGQFIMDANIYVQQFKSSSKNHFAQLWNLQDSYCIQVQIFLQQSRYLLQKLLKQNAANQQTSFSKPLIAPTTSVTQSRRSQIQDQQYDNEDRYKQKRIALLNQYSKAVIGSGGYKINLEDDKKQNKIKKQQQINEKEVQLKRTSSIMLDSKGNNTSNSKKQLKQKNTQTNKKQMSNEQDNPQSQLKSLKYIILLIVILIVCGGGYFAAKVFLKQKGSAVQISEEQSIQAEQIIPPKHKKATAQKKQKKASKNNKKGKSNSDL